MIKIVVAFVCACSLFFDGYQSTIPSKYNYALIPDNSVVAWQGATPKVTHYGSFAVTSQGIEVADGQVISGTFTIPIESIKNFDLPKTIKPVLLKHIKSKDFFHITLYPEARFTLTKVTPLPQVAEASTEEANMMVNGEFTMLGNTHPLSFPAKITFHKKIMTVEASFKLDRTQWGMTHAADPSLGGRHIFPEADIHLKIYAGTND